MFDKIHGKLQESDVVTSITPERTTPAEGVIYFQLITDDEKSPQLKYFQPANSTIVIEDGEIVEFDVRLGKWSPSDSTEEMKAIRKAARNATRQTFLYLSRIDSGGAGGFVPHIRCWEGPIPLNPFLKFLDLLTTEIEFLQTRSENTNPTTA